MSDELKPCPFCGGAKMVIVENTSGDRQRYWHWNTWCDTCGVETSDEGDKTREAATARWNRRATRWPSGPQAAEQLARAIYGAAWDKDTQEFRDVVLRQYTKALAALAARDAGAQEAGSDG